MNKIYLWSIFIVVMIIFSFYWQWPDSRVRLIACDVGQGDAILITQGFTQVLIDGGPPEGNVMACLGKFMPFWDRTIEMVVMSHADSDHAGGLVEVLKRYTVSVLLTSQKHEELDSMTANKKIQVISAVSGVEVRLGMMLYEVLWPLTQDVTEDLNESSVVLRFKYGERSALLTGDLPIEGEVSLCESGYCIPVEVLKVGHHGSKTSTSSTFLDYLQASIALVSVGKNNRFGHPNQEVISQLVDKSIVILRTDETGDIVLVDNNGWEWVQ